MNNETRNDEPAHDVDAEIKRLLATSGVGSDDDGYLSKERIEAIAATDADDEKRELACRFLREHYYAKSLSFLDYFTHSKHVPGGNVLNPFDPQLFAELNGMQQPGQGNDDEDETSERQSGVLTFGLLNEDDIYVEYYEHAYSNSLHLKWERTNGGREPVMTVSGAGLTFLARHAALLQVFEQRFNPEMDEVLSWLSNLGTRHDLASQTVPVTNSATD